MSLSYYLSLPSRENDNTNLLVSHTILMEPTTVTEEVFKEIDESQVLLLLCLIDGATSVLLLNVFVHGMSYGRWILLISSMSLEYNNR